MAQDIGDLVVKFSADNSDLIRKTAEARVGITKVSDAQKITALSAHEMAETYKQVSIDFESFVNSTERIAKATRKLTKINDDMVDSSDKVASRMKKVAKNTRESNSYLEDQTGVLNKLGDAHDKLASRLRKIALAYVAYSARKVIVQTAEDVELLRARIRLFVNAQVTANAAVRDLFGVARSSRSSFRETANLYVSILSSTRQLGLATGDVLKLTSTVGKAIALGGATATESAAAIRQFSQALASGRLQGDEFRSILENARGLTQALARGLNTDIGGLRELSKSGALTTTVIIGALQSQSVAVGRQFEALPVLVSNVIQDIKNRFAEAVDAVSTFVGLLPSVVAGFSRISEIVSSPAFIGALVRVSQLIKLIADYSTLLIGILTFVLARTFLKEIAGFVVFFGTIAAGAASLRLLRRYSKETAGDLSGAINRVKGAFKDLPRQFRVSLKSLGLFAAVSFTIKQTWSVIKNILSDLRLRQANLGPSGRFTDPGVRPSRGEGFVDTEKYSSAQAKVQAEMRRTYRSFYDRATERLLRSTGTVATGISSILIGIVGTAVFGSIQLLINLLKRIPIILKTILAVLIRFRPLIFLIVSPIAAVFIPILAAIVALSTSLGGPTGLVDSIAGFSRKGTQALDSVKTSAEKAAERVDALNGRIQDIARPGTIERTLRFVINLAVDFKVLRTATNKALLEYVDRYYKGTDEIVDAIINFFKFRIPEIQTQAVAATALGAASLTTFPDIENTLIDHLERVFGKRVEGIFRRSPTGKDVVAERVTALQHAIDAFRTAEYIGKIPEIRQLQELQQITARGFVALSQRNAAVEILAGKQIDQAKGKIREELIKEGRKGDKLTVKIPVEFQVKDVTKTAQDFLEKLYRGVGDASRRAQFNISLLGADRSTVAGARASFRIREQYLSAVQSANDSLTKSLDIQSQLENKLFRAQEARNQRAIKDLQERIGLNEERIRGHRIYLRDLESEHGAVTSLANVYRDIAADQVRAEEAYKRSLPLTAQQLRDKYGGPATTPALGLGPVSTQASTLSFVDELNRRLERSSRTLEFDRSILGTNAAGRKAAFDVLNEYEDRLVNLTDDLNGKIEVRENIQKRLNRAVEVGSTISVEALRKQLEGQNKSVLAAETAIGAYKAQGAEVANLAEKFALNAEAAQRVADRAQVLQSAQNAFSSFFDRIVEGSQSASESLRSLARELLNVAIRSSLINPLGEYFGKAFTNFGSSIIPGLTPAAAGAQGYNLSAGGNAPIFTQARAPTQGGPSTTYNFVLGANPTVNRAMIENAIMPRVKSVAKAEIYNAATVPGALKRALKGR